LDELDKRMENEPMDEEPCGEEEMGVQEREASELHGLVEEVEQEEPPSEAQAQPPQKRIKGPGAFAWLAAALVMLFGVVMPIPSLCNSMLSVPALTGLLAEATGNYEDAYEAYGFLEEIEPGVAQLGESVFAPGSGEVPGYTTGSFISERRLLSVSRQTGGPMSQYTQQYFSAWFPEGTRVPRSLRMISNIAQAAANRDAPINQDDAEDVMVLNAIAAARAKDSDKSRALIYDTLELYAYANQSLVSDEVGQRIEKLQKARGSQPWMYEDIAFYRALRMGEYDFVVRQCEERLKRNKEDYASMLFHVKALYLDGDKEAAYALAETYGQDPVISNMMTLYKAELKYRDGDYDASIALADEVTAIAEADPQFAQYAPEAAAYKGAALLLAGKARQALDLLRPFTESGAQVSNTFLSTLLAAAIAAGDEDYYDAFMAEQLMMYQYTNGYAIPPVLEDLRAGRTTLKTIFTEGWGGFDV
jgi:hypothetical protein